MPALVQLGTLLLGLAVGVGAGRLVIGSLLAAAFRPGGRPMTSQRVAPRQED